MIVDEIKREVILVCETEWDINLSEHGIAISFRDGRWGFNYEEYLSDYKDSLEEEETVQLWEIARFTNESSNKGETDTSFILGIWEFDSLAS